MEIDERRLIEKYIYLENTNVLSKLEILKKNTLLQIDFLRNSLARKKYIVGDTSLSPDDARKVEELSSAFVYEKENLSEERKNLYLMNIAIEEEKLAKYLEYLKELEADIAKSKKKIENLRKGIIPGYEDGRSFGEGLEDDEDESLDRTHGGTSTGGSDDSEDSDDSDASSDSDGSDDEEEEESTEVTLP